MADVWLLEESAYGGRWRAVDGTFRTRRVAQEYADDENALGGPWRYRVRKYTRSPSPRRNVRDPENRSKKSCVCGGHSRGARKKRKARQDAK